MVQKETRTQIIVRLTSRRFPLLATSRVNVEQLIRFVLAKRNALESAQQQKIGNDARDISYTAGLLKPISIKGLRMVQSLKQREVRQYLMKSIYPFSTLNKKTREKMLHLPISWIREGALWQLESRKQSQAVGRLVPSCWKKGSI